VVEKRMPRANEQSDREASFLSALATANRNHQRRHDLTCPYLVEAFDHRYDEERREYLLYFELLPGRDLNYLYGSFHHRKGVPKERRPWMVHADLVEWTIPNQLDEPYWLHYFWQVVEAVEYMHELGYVHGDLKTENVMLDWFGNVKVSNGEGGVVQGVPKMGF
jgi:serine/threonine protein kinase